MEKTYVFDGGGNNSIDPNLWAALGNNGGGFGGGFNNPFWAIILLAFLRNGFGWNGDGSNTGFVASQLGQAVAGNGNAISNLATSLNCTEGQIRTAIDGVQSSIANVANQTGMSAMQIINAIQAGNTGIMNQISQCCCDNKLLATQQGYENRIANTEQTAILGGKIDAQTTLIGDKFCQLEMREMQHAIDNLREQKGELTAALTAANSRAERQAELAPIYKALNDIQCKQPATIPVQYQPFTAIPNCVAWQMGLNGLGLGYNGNGSIWS